MSSEANPSDHPNITIVYQFELKGEAPIVYELELDGDTLALVTDHDEPPPDWTRLDFAPCEECPLDPKVTPYCPVAVNLNQAATRFRAEFSIKPVRVTVTTRERTFFKETSLNNGLYALFGLIMSTSECPILDFLRPMARFHLPFASIDEAVMRHTSMYLLGQYFALKQGKRFDRKLKGLEEHFRKVTRLNRDFSKRLSRITRGDASHNAINVLNNYACMTSLVVKHDLKYLEYLWGDRTHTGDLGVESQRDHDYLRMQVSSPGLPVSSPGIDEEAALAEFAQSSPESFREPKPKPEADRPEQRFGQIMDTVRGIITIKGVDGRYQFVNPRAERTFGVSQEQMKGKTAAEIFPPEVASIIESNDTKALAKGAHDVVEEVLPLQGVHLVLISERFPLTDSSNNVLGLCCVARDDTRQRKLQAELVQAERMAAVGSVVAGVAHELNNPMTGILSVAEDLLARADEQDPLRQDYEIIVKEALRCRRIMRDLEEFSRQRVPQRRRLSIDRVVRQTLEVLEQQSSFRDVTFDVAFEEGLPQVDIDPSQIQQAILNLATNARDAVDARGKISIRCESWDEGRSVAVCVADDGCGIPADQMDQILKPFYSTKGDRGNGLGLPAVQSVVERHGGKLEVESEVGVGSAFRMILPRAGS